MTKNFKEEGYAARAYRQKAGSNRLLFIFLIFFILGFGFFFSSTAWLPKTYVGVVATKLGDAVTQGDRTVYIEGWSYSKLQKRMEILCRIESMSLDGIDDYQFIVKTKDGRYQVTTVLQTEDGLYVLWADGLPRTWTEASLTISLSEKDQKAAKEFEPFVIYTSDKEVKVVRSIRKKSEMAYLREASAQQIDVCDRKIRSLQKKVKSIDGKVREAESKIDEVTADLSYLTESEKEEAEDQIAALKMQKDSLLEEKEATEKEIEEIKERISLLNQRLQDMKNNQDAKVEKVEGR